MTALFSLKAGRNSAGRTALRYSMALTGLGLSFAATALAHEDDPKILDRKPPVAGSGFQAGLPAGALLPGGGANTAAAGFPASGIQLESWLTFSDLGNGSENGNDCWGYVSPSGREYALMGTTSATVVVEVTNPSAPTVIQRISGPSSTWRDIKVYQDRAYSVSEAGNGIQVINLSDVDNGNVSLENTITGNGTDASHNVAIDEDSGFLYRSGGGSNGLRIYSLANPGVPVFVGQWNARYVHDVQVVTYTTGAFAGREIAYCCGGLNGGSQDTGLSVVDVTNKANPVVISQIAYPSRRYSHQGWLSEDRTRFYLGDELDEGNTVSVTTTHVFDVSDPANTSYIGEFDNGDAAIGHNMYSHNGKLFQANYTSGLRIFDLTASLNSPPEVAFFDTAPSNSSASFNGLWSCFPYFPSGTVIGSDIESGLFVWSVGEPQLEVNLVSAAPDLISPNGASVGVTITELVPGALDPASPVLVYDIGAGATSVALSSNGGTSYTANFPSLACGTPVSWYIQADSISGQTATAPEGAPATTFQGFVGDQIIVARADDMEAAAGWQGGVAGDTASTGIWTRGNPVGTAAQPEDDHTAVGTQCWFTGQGSPGGSLGANDVDGGATTLITPIIDMSSLNDPIVSYYRWYSNDQGGSANADVFRIEISNNGGSSWNLVEQVGPSGAGTSGGWIQHSFEVGSVSSATSQMQMRFIASDLGTGSIVEAAIDDFEVKDISCGDGIGTLYCDANTNSSGQTGSIIAGGSNIVANNNLSLVAVSLPSNVNGYFVVSPNQAFVMNPAGSQGNLCVGASTGRYISQIGNSGIFGDIPLTVDLTSIPQPMGSISVTPGDTLNFQLWHRDANPGVTSNFTRGYSVTFQ